MTVGLKHLVAGTALAAMAAVPVMAEKARDLQYIQDMRGSSAESELRNRGFVHVSTHKDSGYAAHSYWWNSKDDDCLAVTTYDGRVSSLRDASDQDCGHHKGDDVAAAVGVVAGAAILGALLGHKSHHHDDNKHHEDRNTNRQFERGYQDGLHNASYHNYDRSDAYSDGYRAGVDERNANLRHHHGHGGYDRKAKFNDLNGARARSGMDQLERRGFRQVDNFTSGNTRYSIQYRSQSRQCIQVTIADGRFYDVRDIGRHPQCR
ncbi:hypothetical protein KUW15_04385 [Qipengyuania aquimaris]|uniref:hypothetical protein n=1 Tax=Qipengyuania aquimaris TaxID=255984 RepID=UPI001C948728|nr:hypothetical protein [Qipengyuania aquimaris]MBY6127945.1 hypothetical protein [Qipengyuania aquimaris]UOR15612.1 hypothetical protein LCM05_00810 [Qipengyuania aquimaris]